MARGITESDVHSAADELVALGERPTIERIRAHLGTGSPNTVMRWLDTWWQGLGQRLEVHHARLTVPAAPDAVAALAGDWWALALKCAGATADEAVAADRAALEAARRSLDEERLAFSSEAAALRQAADHALQAERLALARADELERLVSRLTAEGDELRRQREAALAQSAQSDEERRTAEARLLRLQDDTRAEREAATQHVRAVEDRAHGEVDRARQETKELRQRLDATIKEHERVTHALRKAAEVAAAKSVEALQKASVDQARAEALERQLAKLQDLPQAMEAAWKRQETARKSSSGRGTKRSRSAVSHVPAKTPKG
jgi:hypothetical protein